MCTTRFERKPCGWKVLMIPLGYKFSGHAYFNIDHEFEYLKVSS